MIRLFAKEKGNPTVPEFLRQIHPPFEELEDNPFFLRLVARQYESLTIRQWKREARQGRLQDLYLAMPVRDIVDAVTGHRLYNMDLMYTNFNRQTVLLFIHLTLSASLLGLAMFLDEPFIRLAMGFAIAIMHLAIIYCYFDQYECIARAYNDTRISTINPSQFFLNFKLRTSSAMAESVMDRIFFSMVWKRIKAILIISSVSLFILLALMPFTCEVNPIDIAQSVNNLFNDQSSPYLSELIFAVIVSISFALTLVIHLYYKDDFPEQYLARIRQVREQAIKSVEQNIRQIIYNNSPDGSW